ncbi:hypothetical protein BVX98_02010, partial [bacterium F11]
RGVVKAVVNDVPTREREHEAGLKRLSDAEVGWKKFTRGSPIEVLFSEDYAGLFRNPKAQPEADVKIYNEHIYPVFSKGRCRQNVTGLPDEESLAKKHVEVFASHCQ